MLRRAPQGVVVGVIREHEDLLPWWFDNYQRFNNHPVAVADFGMSEEGKQYAARRAVRIDARRLDGGGWFRKPFAIAVSPYNHTIWSDVDVEIRGSLEPFFDAPIKGLIGIGLDRFLNESPCPAPNFRKNLRAGCKIYDSGFIAVRPESFIVRKWMDCVGNWNTDDFAGDSIILSIILDEHPEMVVPFRKDQHVMRCEESNRTTVVFHWTGGPGKEAIRKTILGAKGEAVNLAQECT